MEKIRLLFVSDNKYFDRFNTKKTILLYYNICKNLNMHLKIATRGANSMLIFIKTLCLLYKIDYELYSSPSKFKSMYCKLNDNLYSSGSIRNRSVVNKIAVNSSDIVHILLFLNDISVDYDIKQIYLMCKKNDKILKVQTIK